GAGKTVILGVQNEREWALFCTEVLQQPNLIRDERFSSNVARNAHRAVLKEIIEAVFVELPIEDVLSRLDGARIGNAQMNTMNDVWVHPQLQARDRWREIDSPAGSIPALLPPGLNDSFDYRLDAVPALGQHTHSILHELGYGDDVIAQMQADEII